MNLENPRKMGILKLLKDQTVIGPTRARARVEGVTDGTFRSFRTRVDESGILALDLGTTTGWAMALPDGGIERRVIREIGLGNAVVDDDRPAGTGLGLDLVGHRSGDAGNGRGGPVQGPFNPLGPVVEKSLATDLTDRDGGIGPQIPDIEHEGNAPATGDG